MLEWFRSYLSEVCSNNEAHIYLFADDAKLCRHIVHESDYELLQTALGKLQDWSETWLLKLNIQKCKAVSYCRNMNKDYKYHILQEGMKMIVQRDDFGVTFDEKVDFGLHVAEKVNTNLYFTIQW